jgi:hypothetical protein
VGEGGAILGEDCGGQISPGSTRRLKDLATVFGPDSSQGSSLRGPREARPLKWVDTRLD